MLVPLLVRVLERIVGIDSVPGICIVVLLVDGYVIVWTLMAYAPACSSPGSDPLPKGPLQFRLALGLAASQSAIYL